MAGGQVRDNAADRRSPSSPATYGTVGPPYTYRRIALCLGRGSGQREQRAVFLSKIGADGPRFYVAVRNDRASVERPSPRPLVPPETVYVPETFSSVAEKKSCRPNRRFPDRRPSVSTMPAHAAVTASPARTAIARRCVHLLDPAEPRPPL